MESGWRGRYLRPLYLHPRNARGRADGRASFARLRPDAKRGCDQPLRPPRGWHARPDRRVISSRPDYHRAPKQGAGRSAAPPMDHGPPWYPAGGRSAPMPLLDGARPGDGRDGNWRGGSEAIPDQAKHAGGEQEPHVTHLGNAYDLLVRGEDTRHDEIVGARNHREEAYRAGSMP